ncbi:hypothetical protein HZH66_006523 [Vespula vulgaris]|uniref:Uncharacterized protein n=1 Tax=Vespula vulgaris TaxID=7454 RepID=A0A834K791_VESVU|nr:hypothetical protein HZH66_006523 [Vespula vulgaris]
MEDEDESMSRSRMEKQSACTPQQESEEEEKKEKDKEKGEEKEELEEEEEVVVVMVVMVMVVMVVVVEDASRLVRRETARKSRDSRTGDTKRAHDADDPASALISTQPRAGARGLSKGLTENLGPIQKKRANSTIIREE